MNFLDNFIPLISAYCVPFSDYLGLVFVWLVPFGVLGIIDAIASFKVRRY